MRTAGSTGCVLGGLTKNLEMMIPMLILIVYLVWFGLYFWADGGRTYLNLQG